MGELQGLYAAIMFKDKPLVVKKTSSLHWNLPGLVVPKEEKDRLETLTKFLDENFVLPKKNFEELLTEKDVREVQLDLLNRTNHIYFKSINSDLFLKVRPGTSLYSGMQHMNLNKSGIYLGSMAASLNKIVNSQSSYENLLKKF